MTLGRGNCQAPHRQRCLAKDQRIQRHDMSVTTRRRLAPRVCSVRRYKPKPKKLLEEDEGVLMEARASPRVRSAPVDAASAWCVPSPPRDTANSRF